MLSPESRSVWPLFALTGPLMSTLGGRRSIATMDAVFEGLAAIRFERDQTRHSDRKGRGEVVSGGPRPCPCLREWALFILVADVHRRVTPIETSLEWLLLFASHQNVIKFEKEARPRLASKPSHQHSNNPCRHCGGNRCPKSVADVGADLLFLARPLNFSFTEPTQGERPLWVRIDTRAMTDRVEHSTLPVGFKLGAPRGLLLQVCHGASRKVSTVPQLDDNTLPQQWHSNRSARSLFH